MTAGIQRAARLCPATAANPGPEQCGITLAADLARTMTSEPLFARLCGQLGDLLGRRLPVSLLLQGLEGDDPAALFDGFCRRLGAALDAPGAHCTGLAISISSSALPPDLAWRIRRRYLHPACLNIICDARSVAADDFWLRLWRLRREQSLTAAVWPVLRSTSPLLPAEPARQLEPVFGLQVPTASAWLSASIHLPDFVSANGEVADEALRDALASTVARLDTDLEVARWPTAAMRQDAWLNRRLAIRVDGIGDLAQRLKRGSAAHASLPVMHSILSRVRTLLQQQTRHLAKCGELLPAIELGSPVRALGPGAARECWEKRWLRAVRRSGVRHRNLLALSPWALFPAGDADPRYQDLLPLLLLGDVCAFREKPDLAGWNVSHFKRFHQRLWALMRQIEAQSLVAECL